MALSISACASRSGTASSKGSIQRRTFMSVDERRLKTESRIAAAMFVFEVLGTWRSSSAVTILTCCRWTEADTGSADVVNDDRVQFLRASLSRP